MIGVPTILGGAMARATRLSGRQITVLAILLAVLVAGTAVRCWGLADRPLWEDEAYTWKDSLVPYHRLLLWKHDPRQGPLSHLLVRHSMMLLGTDDAWAMRLPSLVCGILCIPAAWWLGRTIHSDAVGLLAALLVALDPNMVDQSQQARMYTMLALVWMVVLERAIRLLRDPPASRRPWIVFGVLLSVPLALHFGALVLWLGVASGAAGLVLYHRARGESEVHSPAIVRGLAITYLTATILSARGLWKFYRFATDGHADPNVATGQRFWAIVDGTEQLTAAGRLAPVVLLLAAVGLILVARRCRASAVVLAATGAAGLAMVYHGQTMHQVMATRYFTVVQPTLWIGLAALPVLAASATRRAVLAAALVAVIAAQGWESTHLDRWNDMTTWRFVRDASAFIRTSRDDRDHFACTPYIHFNTLARYYQVMGPADDRLQQHATQGKPADDELAGSAAWMIAFMHDARAEPELRAMLSVCPAGDPPGLDTEQIVAQLKTQSHAVLRLAQGRVDCCVYEPSESRFNPLEQLTAQRLGKSAGR